MPADTASFYSKTRAARKIIVVDLGFLGDTVHLLPSLKEIKRNYPEAALHVMTTPVGCEVLALAPWVDRAWAVEMSKEKRTLRQQWQVIRAVRGERFDVAFNFTAADRTLFMTTLTGAPWRIAYSGGRPHFWKKCTFHRAGLRTPAPDARRVRIAVGRGSVRSRAIPRRPNLGRGERAGRRNSFFNQRNGIPERMGGRTLGQFGEADLARSSRNAPRGDGEWQTA